MIIFLNFSLEMLANIDRYLISARGKYEIQRMYFFSFVFSHKSARKTNENSSFLQFLASLPIGVNYHSVEK